MIDSARPIENLDQTPGGEIRSGLDADCIRQSIVNNLFYTLGRFPSAATTNDWYLAVAYSVRDRLLRHWLNCARHYKDQTRRTVCYLSAEFLIGPQLGNNLINMDIYDQTRDALSQLGLSLDDILQQEEEPGLGHGGLGRLAACYLDSLATLNVPAIGYGVRYEFGLFNQEFSDGWQVEKTDKWLLNGNPWELARHKIAFDVNFGGHTERSQRPDGSTRISWIPANVVKGVAYDTPIVGYGDGASNINLLRLWKAEAPEEFDFQAFTAGDHFGAIRTKISAELLSKVLYPNDQFANGKRLRLQQQYFFVSCSLQDMIRIHLETDNNPANFQRKYAVQLNDTHPAIAIPELMRLLVDEHDQDWERAWAVTQQTFTFTNHTLLPEAIETWSVDLLSEILPRHMEIIYEINQRFLDEARMHYHGNESHLAALSIIGEHGNKHVRMANLACVGSHRVNGVANLHTRLLKENLLTEFDALWPEKVTNVTNGITPRRFLRLGNPSLSALISEHIGDCWLTDLEQLKQLEPLAEDTDFQQQWFSVKRHAKTNLTRFIQETCTVAVNPDSLFDIQAKRIHEYKRQHLNLLHVITLYNRIKDNPNDQHTPRTVIFSGKAAPAYATAKLIIKLINEVAQVINNDPDVRDQLKVAFVPNFNLKNAMQLYPAADLSEQISMAGKEASGTGNMKFALNGALTLGTADGANLEICEAVGAENFFLFGHNVSELAQRTADGYRPRDIYDNNPELRAAVDLINSGLFSHGDHGLYRPLTDSLLDEDRYFLFADYESYLTQQKEVERVYNEKFDWARRSILNVARMGWFSSDRAVREYCERIWHVTPVAVPCSDFS